MAVIVAVPVRNAGTGGPNGTDHMHRSARYEGLSEIVDEEAVNEMASWGSASLCV